MKNIIFGAFALLTFSVQTNAQTVMEWMTLRSTNPNAKAVHTVLSKANAALAISDYDHWLGYATNEVTLSNPLTGNMLVGKTAIREASAGTSPADSPKYSYENVQVRLLPNDYAVAIWGIARISDNAKSQATATLRKVSGQWRIELCVCDLAEML